MATTSKQDRRSPLGYTVLIVAALLTLVPFVYAVLGSLKTSGQISTNPLGLPDPWVWENYAAVLGGDVFWRPLLNSVLVGLLTVLIVLICGTLATFALSRFTFRGRESVYAFFTLGLLFPAAVAILPLYLMLRELDLLNTPLGVALPQAAFALPVTVVILRPFFQSIPQELEEAAAMDGAGPMRFFLRILLPMSVPVLITVSILALVTSWNGYLLPLLILTDPESWTIPLGLSRFAGSYTYDTARVLAYSVVAMVPTVLAYGVAERYIVQGLTAGAVKG
ncbi:carbohydrate ABC transporter permease [Microbacterium atlanticum]|uniref:carbohydrate ABC transporter permease n=1 Tax=Microbacterium atlanticum TaxID=2782168 RepID=UPI0018876911|nr:carbohydrate ABC transporter permease [Microbacterium atlanticum]